MTIYEGSDITVGMGNNANPGLAIFLTLQGVRVSSLRIDAPLYNKRALGSDGWIQAVTSAGQKQMRMEAEGLFHNGAGEVLLQDYALSGQQSSARFTFGNGHTLTCPVHVTRFERVQIPFEAERYSATMVSSGTVIYNTI